MPLKLIAAFVEKQPIKSPRENLNPVIVVNLANLKLILATQPAYEEKSYYLLDFFKTHFDIVYRDSNDKTHPISQHYLLSRDMLESLSNVKYDVIVADLKNVGNYNMANLSLLEMIAAYDMDANTELFEALRELSLWILEYSPEEELPYSIRLLNHLQIIKRERPLEISEVRSLCELTETQNQREEILIGAYLLLDNQLAAEVHFTRLDESVQKEFVKYPIYKFWNQTSRDNL